MKNGSASNVTTETSVISGRAVRTGILHENYRCSDFALDGVEPATVPAVLTLGEQSR